MGYIAMAVVFSGCALRMEIFFMVILPLQLKAIAESGFDHGVGHVGHSDWLGRYTLGGTLE